MITQKILEGIDVTIGYSKSQKDKDSNTFLYQGLNFELNSGELVCLLGINGAGKSTLLRTICSLQPALTGTINFFNKPIYTYSEKELSKLLGLVLTDKTSVGGFTVRELVELGRYPYTGFLGQLSDKDYQIVEKALSDVCIIHKANSYISELSDGERQKVMIAKALAQECPVIILDEPTAFLDIESRVEVINLLHYLARYQNKTILLSTHDVDLALLLADRLWLLSQRDGLITGFTEKLILSGVMDTFFDINKIKFNKSNGSFLPNIKYKKKAYLEATNIFFLWTKNLLEKHGFQVITEDSTSINIYVKVKSLYSISLKYEETIFNFADYNDFVEWLQEY